MRVRKAVFPAAGWGTRFLPATKAQPKEMLPLVDKPVIQYAVEEAVAAGIEQVIIVTSSQKRAIEDHFDTSYELEHLLESRGDIEMLRRVRHISDLAQVSYVRQKEQLGLGHAVLMARELVGHETFAVILSDDVVVAAASSSAYVSSAVAVMHVPHDQTGRYGVIDPDPDGDDHGDPRLHQLRGLVEKPSPDVAPSDLAVIGRYVLTPKIFEKLEQTPRGAGGEIQLTRSSRSTDTPSKACATMRARRWAGWKRPWSSRSSARTSAPSSGATSPASTCTEPRGTRAADRTDAR